jgi:hypothetical protein
MYKFGALCFYLSSVQVDSFVPRVLLARAPPCKSPTHQNLTTRITTPTQGARIPIHALTHATIKTDGPFPGRRFRFKPKSVLELWRIPTSNRDGAPPLLQIIDNQLYKSFIHTIIKSFYYNE